MFEILGNYFYGNFKLPPISGPESTDLIYTKICPADTTTTLWSCPIDFRDIDKVVDSATQGFRTWKKTSVADRISAINRFKELLLSDINLFSQAISLETGKPYWESKLEVENTISQIDIITNHSLKRIASVNVGEIDANHQGTYSHRPIGPHVIITPFNFPLFTAASQITNQLLAGNTIILKPSEKTIYTGQLIVEALSKCLFPSGVINLINGDGEVARRVAKVKTIRGINFTGSFEAGKNILEICGTNFNKIISLELGGKNTCIIHHDVNLDFAMGDLFEACFATSGQRCTSTSIVAIHNSILDEFISKFHQLSKNIVIDHPIEFESEPFMGPLIDQKALDKYLLFIGMAKREGIEEIMRGKQIPKKHKGYYVTPSIHFSKTFKKESHFLQSEIFGPNCTIIPYDTIEEAVQIANSTTYGLISSIYSNDPEVIKYCQEEIETGTVNVNAPTTKTSSMLPFGGIYNSGNHRPVGLTAIDQCVFPKSSIISTNVTENKIKNLKGLKESL